MPSPSEISKFHRDLMVDQISAFLRKSRPNAPPNIVRQIPALARRIEATLFQSATSAEEYTNKFTLETRMKSIALSSVSLRSKRQRQTPRNSSCDLVKLHNTHLKRAMIQRRDSAASDVADNDRGSRFVACVAINGGDREIAFNFSKAEEPHLARPEAPQASSLRPEMPQEQNPHTLRRRHERDLEVEADHVSDAEEMHELSSAYSSDDEDDDDDDDGIEDDDDDIEDDEDNGLFVASIGGSTETFSHPERQPVSTASLTTAASELENRNHHDASRARARGEQMNQQENLARIHSLLASLVRTPRSQQQTIQTTILELQHRVVNAGPSRVPRRKLTEALAHAMVEMMARMDASVDGGEGDDPFGISDLLEDDSSSSSANMPSAIWLPEIRDGEIEDDQASRLHAVSHLLNFAAEHCASAPVDTDLLGIVLRLLDHMAGDNLLPADKVVLSRSVDRFVEADPASAAPFVVGRLLKRWPYQNSELQVASIAQLEAVFRVSNDAIVLDLIVPVLRRVARCISHDNWHVSNAAMTFAEKLLNFATSVEPMPEVLLTALKDLAADAKTASTKHWHAEVRARATSLAFTIYAALDNDASSASVSLNASPAAS
ncbi:Serine/threonine-protein phosphatase 2A 56 kDa regulatory subunit delta isoform [Hondaea fermentalgiana]|uniref:Serine/threonine-protein phosphatase 2A 56 kDa regulatory subunit delta isoform n=1 Tax=Hondaea fermentalgiana TaxID=2315210 RepID=A0A2R5GSU8_9STRA|nr:Serine/threonine-protein phosphatase 2A 56 kDa regulatory subunit delta isoform [Hondaea fermentalgiana]|eukprot:GBG33665.1 Serine/threonine-protein phosphatase 2A 56 kDa regulatory subunit delta isoform [Hondaea fermentalgiana]